MGILSRLLTLPVSGPIAGALWVAGQVRDAAEAELTDPAAIRRRLAALEAALEAGEIDEESFEAEEAVLIARLAERGGAP